MALRARNVSGSFEKQRNIWLCFILYSDSSSDVVSSSTPTEMKPRLESVDDIEVQNYNLNYSGTPL